MYLYRKEGKDTKELSTEEREILLSAKVHVCFILYIYMLALMPWQINLLIIHLHTVKPYMFFRRMQKLKCITTRLNKSGLLER